jgi:hypothetical protein
MERSKSQKSAKHKDDLGDEEGSDNDKSNARAGSNDESKSHDDSSDDNELKYRWSQVLSLSYR